MTMLVSIVTRRAACAGAGATTRVLSRRHGLGGVRLLMPTRSIRTSAIVHKKKSSKSASAQEEEEDGQDDLFSEDLFVERDLVKPPSSSSSSASASASASASPRVVASSTQGETQGQGEGEGQEKGTRQYRKRRLTPAERKIRFMQRLEYIEPRLDAIISGSWAGTRSSSPTSSAPTTTTTTTTTPTSTEPQEKTQQQQQQQQQAPTLHNNPRIRKRTLLTLLQLASTPEELRRVVDLLPRLRKAGPRVEPGEEFAEWFARRCEELGCPLLALEVFGNHAKYSTRLTLGAGRYLIRSLSALPSPKQVKQPKQLSQIQKQEFKQQQHHPKRHPEHIAVALGLYTAYRLPPISDDLVTAAMVASAYTTHGLGGKGGGGAGGGSGGGRVVPGMREIAERLRAPIREMLVHSKGSGEKASAMGMGMGMGKGRGEEQAERKWENWVRISLERANKAQMARTGEVYVDPSLIPVRNAGAGAGIGVR